MTTTLLIIIIIALVLLMIRLDRLKQRLQSFHPRITPVDKAMVMIYMICIIGCIILLTIFTNKVHL
jgi:multisubunit Na+/H+ antiporter MnhB subunit